MFGGGGVQLFEKKVRVSHVLHLRSVCNQFHYSMNWQEKQIRDVSYMTIKNTIKYRKTLYKYGKNVYATYIRKG